ncbi:MAG TPA: M48 family metallopeptidase [Candidatus Acidoferrales bacterium]|nr:M48 family metallopeptidase [Candidatus Acidoferrales bacterium]
MTRRLIAAALLILGIVALIYLQRDKATAEISPSPILYLVADTEREAERIPLAITRVSEDEENKIGERLAKEYGLSDPNRYAQDISGDLRRIEIHLNDIGHQLAQNVQRKKIRYHFYLDNNPYLVNAFALPGGQIVVGRGLLSLFESEDELAAILGHEITHVDNRHAIERLQYEIAARKIGLDGFYGLGSLAVDIFRAGYAKEQELEADRVGLHFAVDAGFSPAGGVSVMSRFEKLEKEEQQQEANRAGSPIEEFAQIPISALQDYFRSHPPAAERRAAMEDEIRSQGWTVGPQRPFVLRPIFLTDQGEALDRAGDFPASIVKFRQAFSFDANYVRAWRGLAEAEWRAGDAAQTAEAASKAVHLQSTARDWELLARGLAFSDPSGATLKFKIQIDLGQNANRDFESQAIENVELAGLQFLQGNVNAFNDLLSVDTPTNYIDVRASMRREMAFWMSHAGKFDLAANTLEEARQILPQSTETSLALAWVRSDQGRQADATEQLSNLRGSYSNDEFQAVQAVIAMRTNQHESANSYFQQAAHGDPVWLVPAWVQNNFSPSTVAILKQLQQEEQTRRRKEKEKQDELRRHSQPQ